MSVHYASLKGNRDSNEDRHTIILGMNKQCGDIANVNFYGVYDGHGGKFVSTFLANKLHYFFTDPNVKYPLTNDYVNNVYRGLQKILYTKYKEQSTECGSTCLAICQFAIKKRQCINVINVGDSRCVMCHDNLGIPLTKDHKPHWPDEKTRISKLGGKIKFDKYDWRINDLSVSRVFGDKSSEKYVSSDPDLFTYFLTEKDKFIIMACDGLWDVCSSQDAVNFVLNNCYDIDMKRINKNMNIARTLAEHAITIGSSDNVTVIIVFFELGE